MMIDCVKIVTNIDILGMKDCECEQMVAKYD